MLGPKQFPSLRSGFSTLLSVALLYVFILALMLLLAIQVLEGVELRQNVVLWVVLAIAVILPVILLVSVGIQFFHLVKGRKHQHPGAGFRLRIVAYFVALVLFASIPQGILSLNFVRVAVSTWFRPDIGQALESGLTLAVEYYQQEAQRLENFSSSEVLRNVLRSALAEPDRSLGLIRQFRPEVDAIQLVNNSGGVEAYFGPEELFYDPGLLLQEADGNLVRVSLQNHDVIRIKVPVPDAQSPQGALLLSLEISPDFEERARSLQSSLVYFSQFAENQPLFSFIVFLFYMLFSMPLMLVTIHASFFFSKEMVRPVLSLEVATKKVAEGDFGYRILSRKPEDLDHLADSFNKMVSELERSRNKLVHSERIAAWKDMAQRLAHEIKNPLTPIKLSAERLMKKYDQEVPEFRDIMAQSVNTIVSEVDRLALMLTEFRNFARLPNPEPVEFQLHDLLGQIRSLYQEYPNIRIDIESVQEDTMIYGDPKQVKQVLGNLIKNSLEAFEGREGRISFGAFPITRSDREYCRIVIEDDGPGVPGGLEIFTPYVTSKQNGTGLGLAIVERIVSDHLGQISYDSSPGKGTRFYLDFPYP